MTDEQAELIPGLGHEQLRLPGPGEQSGPPPLDAPQEFTDAGSFEVRDRLGEILQADLVGPWDGEHEEFRPNAPGPRDRYLVGALGPRHLPRSVTAEADEMPETEAGTAGDGADAELPNVMTPQALGRMWASSMGLSFAVPQDVEVIHVTAQWGTYDRHQVEDAEGKKTGAWRREPHVVEREIRVGGLITERIPLTGERYDAPGVHLSVVVRWRDGQRIVELALLNAQSGSPNATPTWLFQTELAVQALDGDTAIFLPINDPLDGVTAPGTDPEEAHLRLLYREQRRYASGRNVAVHAEVRPGERRAHRLVTTWLPAYEVPATVAPDDSPHLEGVELSMDRLADPSLTVAELRTGLAPLANGYRAWLDERETEIAGLPEPLRPAAESAVFTARNAAARIRTGVDLLTDPSAAGHADALTAFRFANRAMALQRRHTEIAALREAESLGFAEAEAKVAERGASAASWRPFQLAFVLLNLPPLANADHPDRAAIPLDGEPGTGVVDLLFFPTGGGKTEAYLGLTAFTFAIRRLQGVIGSGAEARSGFAGVAVLMRYTLRLLTAQQFQRAAALVCAAEWLRREDETTWGSEPFRIGLWVGMGVSPNWWDDADRQIAAAREAGDGKRVNVLQTLTCPWCGEPLRAQHDLEVSEPERRVRLFCPRGEGARACPFSRTQDPDGLPILTVDEEIYRYVPSLVIATVDKLAQMPWRGYAGMLFGRVRAWCPRHGYRHDDMSSRTQCGTRHNSHPPLPSATSQNVRRLRPPDLIIQDELHLISGALGTTVGLFEAAVDELCTWRLPSGAEAAPKIVASTATTKRAAEQVRGVFGRDLAIFPPQVIDIGDTFFSRQVPVTEQTPGRRYLGVCAHGTRLKSAEIRLAEILLIAGQTLFDRYGAAADPYMTLVDYFNATRELAGMRRYLDDDVTTRVRTGGRTRGLSDRIATRAGMLTVQELTSRISSADISDVLQRLEHTFAPELDTSTRRGALPAEFVAARKERRDPHPLAARFGARADSVRQPVDVVLATSMLQVGVDVSRFGLMVVMGQPKNTAEYIQASSRVGRDPRRPGFVVTLYNWSRPRDLAHFEDFAHYHATFYRQVEALSVTPYARRALDRGTAGTFVAAVRNHDDDFSHNRDAFDVPLDDPRVRTVRERFLRRAEIIAGMRGRDYLDERLNVVLDRWKERKTGSTRLAYQTVGENGEQLVGLLDLPGSGAWHDLTVGLSMRETENEINLLVPASDQLYAPAYGAPAWTYGPPVGGSDEAKTPGGDNE